MVVRLGVKRSQVQILSSRFFINPAEVTAYYPLMFGGAVCFPSAQNGIYRFTRFMGVHAMPRLTKSLPKYRKHKASAQAVVTIAGRDIYLGPHGINTSKVEFVASSLNGLLRSALLIQLLFSERLQSRKSWQHECGTRRSDTSRMVSLPRNNSESAALYDR